MRSVLFVCLGNICRSPLAEGVFRHQVEDAGLADQFQIDSAGTGSWHVGSPPDQRSIAIAAKHGIDISMQRARQFSPDDFDNFDLIFAMDRDNLRKIRSLAPEGAEGKAHLFFQYALDETRDVPDPYYGGADGFLNVYQMLSAGCSSILGKL